MSHSSAKIVVVLLLWHLPLWSSSFSGLLQNVAAGFWSLPQMWWLWYICSSFEATAYLSPPRNCTITLLGLKLEVHTWLDTMAPLVLTGYNGTLLLMMAYLSHWSLCQHCYTNLWDRKLIEKEWLGGTTMITDFQSQICTMCNQPREKQVILFFRHRYNKARRPFWGNF